MDYRIIFLGTAGNNGSFQNLKSAGGFVLKFYDKQFSRQFHIDPGPGALTSARMAGINLRETTALFATHSHLNHSNDVNAVINAMTSGGTDKNGTLIFSKSLSEEKIPKDYLKEYMSLEANQIKDFGEITVTALSTKHNDPSTIGLKFVTPRITVTYTSDTTYSKEIVQNYRNSDILILNNVYPLIYKKSSNNLTTEDSIKIIQQVQPLLAIITHFSSKMWEANPLYEAREIQRQTEVQTIAAREGLIIDPLTISSSLRQKSLSQY